MLKRTNDRKTAVRVSADGKFSILRNAFSLPSTRDFSCPDATDACEAVCYAGKLEKRFPSFLSLVQHNWEVLNSPEHDMMLELFVMIESFKIECEKHNVPKLFRWHADGDIFSDKYAQCIAVMAREYPDIKFWIYTRSFDYVGHIVGYDNLAVYLSVDEDNLQEAKKTWNAFDNVRIAYLGEVFEDGKEFLKTLTNKPGAICPENAKRIPLITNKGGACISCRLCIDGKADVRFASKGK